MFHMPTPRRTVLAAAVLLLSGCVNPPATDQTVDFVLFFTAQSAALDTQAASIIDSAASAAKTTGASGITIAGYADRAGSPQANQILSRLRAQIVADGLVERGVDRARIHLQPRGATGGDPGVESRRVEVFVGR